jgi:hypothetical protein
VRPTSLSSGLDAGRRGFALILVMVGLVTLTILGVTAISASQLDMKITQNMRHHKAVQYGAIAGQEHARSFFDGDGDDMQDRINEVEALALAGSGDCLTGWIDATAPTALDLPTVITANGFGISTYSVDLCTGLCGLGDSLSQGGGGATDKQAFVIVDAVATGTVDSVGTAASTAQAGVFIGSHFNTICNN